MSSRVGIEMRQFNTRTYGKWILAGEHAVLRGCPALAFPLTSRSLHLEQEANGVHITALCPGFTFSEFHDVTGNRAQVAKMPSYMWMTAEVVAQEGFDAVMRNKAVHVNGPVNKSIVLLAKYLPDQVGLMIMRARSRDIRTQ